MINIDTVKKVFKKKYNIDLIGPFGSYLRTNGLKFNDLDFIAPHLPDDRRFIQYEYEYDGNKKIDIDIWEYKDSYEKFFLEFALSEDKGHSIGYRIKAKKKGLKLTQYGLFDKDGHKINVKNKTELLKLIT